MGRQQGSGGAGALISPCSTDALTTPTASVVGALKVACHSCRRRFTP